MSDNDGFKRPEASNSTAAKQTAPKAAPTASDIKHADKTFEELFGIGMRTTSGRTSPEALTTCLETMQDLIKTSGSSIDVFLINEPEQIRVPVIVLSSKFDNKVYYFSLLIESHVREALPDVTLKSSLNGQQVPVRRPTVMMHEEVFNKRVMHWISTRTSSEIGGEVGFCVVPETVDIADSNVASIYFDTVTIAFREFSNVTNGQQVITADRLASRDMAITSSYQIHPGETASDVLGTPVAADFSSVLSASLATVHPNEIHTDSSSLTLARATGIMDFYYAPEQPDIYAQNQQQRIYRGYHPHMIITDVSGLDVSKAYNTETVLTPFLGFLAVAEMASNHNWAAVFDPRYAAKDGEFGKAPIGAFGFEHNATADPNFKPGMLDVTSGTTRGPNGEMSVMDVISNYCHDDLRVSIDIEMGGRMSWASQVMVDAANGNAESHATLVAVLDGFSGGRFSANYNGPLFCNMPIVIDLGYYKVTDGEFRDIRDIDSLTALNLVGQTGDVNALNDFSSAVEVGGDTVENMAKRRDIIKQMVSNVEFTGLATRVTFADGVLQAWLNSMAEHHLEVRTEGLAAVNAQQVRGANYSGQGMNQRLSTSAINATSGAHGTIINPRVSHNNLMRKVRPYQG